ncbi:MAG: metallophosphoesterase [bacterium]|nr:metallophosphoesterase [bacterium]
MSKYLIVGDLHLGKGLSIGKPGIGNALNSRIVDQMKLLDWVTDQAIDNEVSTIIFTGDICEDAKPDYILIEMFIEFLKKLEINNIDVNIIGGNHDFQRTGSHYKSFLDLITAAELPTVHIHKYVTTIIKDNVGFTLLPFRDRRSLDCKTDTEAFNKLSTLLTYELESIPNNFSCVLIGHLALKGSIFVGDEFDNEANELMCPLEMFSGYDYVWMGHVHKPQVRTKVPYIAHVGSLDISDFGETDHKKIIILFDSSDRSFKELNVPTRPLCRVQLDIPEGFSSTNYVIDYLKALNKKHPLINAILKIEIKLLDVAAENINRQLVEDTAYGFGVFHICNLSESRSITVVPITKLHDIDNKINTKTAVKIWANNEKFENEQEKSDFIDLANKFIEEYEVKYN